MIEGGGRHEFVGMTPVQLGLLTHSAVTGIQRVQEAKASLVVSPTRVLLPQRRSPMRKTLTIVLAFSGLTLGLSRSSLSQGNASQTPVSVASERGNREQDGLDGPVRRVRVEVAKIILKDGKSLEGPRQVLGIATYDPAGSKIDSVAYPTDAHSPPGKQEYRYDDKGNLVEAILRSADGSMLSKEAYKYEFDPLGNWTKMITSVAIYENGNITFEPTEITYRAISYYYSQAIEKLNAASPKSNGVPARSTSSPLLPNSNAASTDSRRPATTTVPASTAPVSAIVQPRSEGMNPSANKEQVSAPASVVPANSSTPTADNPVSTASEMRASAENVAATSVVRRVEEDVLRNAAVVFPKPEYSDAARLARASGKVTVQILVDENGNVTNAQATSGHPLLGPAAEAAARKARFSFGKAPSTRVYGEITYNFALPTFASEAIAPTDPPKEKNSLKPATRNPEAAPIPEKTTVIESKSIGSANYLEAAKSFYDKGVIFQAAGQYPEAAEAFNQAVKLNPNDANAYARLGMAYSSMLKHTDALVVYKMAANINRDVLGAPAYYMWGHSYLALEKNSEALQAFKRAFAITKADAVDPEGKETQRYPSLEQLHYSLGITYLNTKRFDKAIDELKQAVDLNEKNAHACYALAIAHLLKGNRREAESLQQVLTSLDPTLAQKLADALAGAEPTPGCRTIACRPR